MILFILRFSDFRLGDGLCGWNLKSLNLKLLKFAHEFFRVDDKAVVDG